MFCVMQFTNVFSHEYVSQAFALNFLLHLLKKVLVITLCDVTMVTDTSFNVWAKNSRAGIRPPSETMS